MRFSASRIKAWMDCPLRAHYRYDQNLPSRQNAKASFGTIMHRCLEHYNNTGDYAGAVEMFKDLWSHPHKAGVEPDYWPKMTSYASLRAKGLDILKATTEHHRWCNRTVVGTEIPFLVPFGEHELYGFVDLVEIEKSGTGKELLKIVDYKTNSGTPSVATLALDVQFCVDGETEALTQRGWVRHDDLTEHDTILTYNQNDGVAEWQPVQSIHRFEAIDQELVRLGGHGHSSLTTKNHRWPVRHTVTGAAGWRQEERIVMSEDLTGSDAIRCAAPVVNLPTDLKYNDRLVELVGWVWTEGYFRQGKYISFSQSQTANPDNVEHIIFLLVNLFGPVSEQFPRLGRTVDDEPRWRYSNDDDCVRFYLNKAASDVLRPHFADVEKMVVATDFITSLTYSQLLLFIDVAVEADGHQRGSVRTVTQACRDRLDVLQMACTLAGVRTSIAYDPARSERYRGREQWNLVFRDRTPWYVPSKAKRSTEQYTGTVWCPRTDNATWLARRDGHVYFTGNTVYAYAASQPEFWMGVDDNPEFNGVENGEWLWETVAKTTPKRCVWFSLWNGKEIDAGPRTKTDFERLYRVCDEIARAEELNVHVPKIGDSCTFCDFQEPCAMEIPVSLQAFNTPSDERWI